MNAKDEILARVRRSLRDVPAGEIEADAPIDWRYGQPVEVADVLDLFAERVADYKAAVVRCSQAKVAEAVRAAWPQDLPLFMRISSVDGPADGWTIEDSVALAKELRARGVDVVDCSAGGIAGAPAFRAHDNGQPLKSRGERPPGFQVPYAERVRRDSGIATMAVGGANSAVAPAISTGMVASGSPLTRTTSSAAPTASAGTRRSRTSVTRSPAAQRSVG